jgi:hypothetical protein
MPEAETQIRVGTTGSPRLGSLAQLGLLGPRRLPAGPARARDTMRPRVITGAVVAPRAIVHSPPHP